MSADDGGAEEQMAWDASAIEALGVPVIQALCVTMSRERWEEGGEGLLPIDAATQVAIPEFDGRIIGGPISFKERDSVDSPVGVPVPRYVHDPERCDRLAGLVLRHARLRDPDARRKVAVVLTAFPTKHARIGMAVGLDTPASAIDLLHALKDDGIDVRDIPADGDALMHALIAAGGHDPEFLTDAILAAAPLRIPARDYLDWYGTLSPKLTSSMEEQWGPAPGDRYIDPASGDLVIAGLEFGDVVVLIQPPRGYGDDQVGIYHDPELAPAHHYMAAYRWLDHHWGADAIVHLGKHGTLEWLPGKMLALSASCAPDAALGSMPLVYPFVVNDPGEGAQAKRRAHAVVIDHLVPPMMRAESYDELADLEALMDEYARLEVLDPSKLPGLGAQIWEAIEKANLQEDLGITSEPGDAGTLVEHLDGYLCEVKDVQIKDGLHVLGAVPEGPQLRGLVAAIGRHGSGAVPGLRRAVAAAFGLDEPALVASPGRARRRAPSAALVERFPGTVPPRQRRARPARGGPARAADRAVRARLGPGRRGAAVPLGARPRRRRRRVGAALRRRPDRAAPAPDDRRDDERARRAARSPHPGRAVGRADPRALRRPADRPQLLLRRPALAAVGAVLRDRREAGRRGARAAPGRHRRAARDGRARGVGDGRDAHPGRRRRRGARAARRAPDVARSRRAA